MSSTFLYVAIVAIWAFVLVPRWLRRQHSAPQHSDEAGYGPDAQGYADEDNGPQDYPAGLDSREADSGQRGRGQYRTAEAADRRQPGRDSAVPHVLPLPRSRVLQARRRLLTMLVLLAAAAASCTVLKLTTWWVCIPPAGMLGIYLLLLREGALADAEQARRRVAGELRVQATRQRAPATEEALDEQPSAQIIDISARVGDQVYDQYADATVRAVGD